MRETTTVWQRPMLLTCPLQAPVRKRSHPHRDWRQESTLQALAASWHCKMRFPLHMSAQLPKLHYLYLWFGSNKALLPALAICHPARERSCCHSTSTDLKWCSKQNILMELLVNVLLACLTAGLCEFRKICERSVLRYAFSLFRNGPFHPALTVLAPTSRPAFSHSQEKTEPSNRHIKSAVKAVCEWYFLSCWSLMIHSRAIKIRSYTSSRDRKSMHLERSRLSLIH